MKRKSLYSLVIAYGLCFQSSYADSTLDDPQQLLHQYLAQTASIPSVQGAQRIKGIFQQNYNNFTLPQQRNSHRAPEQTKQALFTDSLNEFIISEYNSDSYAERLSQDSDHFVQFLCLSKDLALDAELVYTWQRLLYNKLKQTEIIDHTVVE